MLPIEIATPDSQLEARISERYVHVEVQANFSSLVTAVPSATRN
jgi:hypothetical protein